MPVIFLELTKTYDVIINGVSLTKAYRTEKKQKALKKKKEIKKLTSQKELLDYKEKYIKHKLEFGIMPSKKIKIVNKQSNQVKGNCSYNVYIIFLS